MKQSTLFPELPLQEWEDTKKTLHLYSQIVGKVKFELATRVNHWWHITLRLNSRGWGTNLIPYHNGGFSIDFDFIQHQVIIHTTDGEIEIINLSETLSVPEFHKQLFDKLNLLNIKAEILAKPFDFETTKPFSECVNYKSYDKEYVQRFWQILVQIDSVFQEFRGRFVGKNSPAQLFWHSFDYAVTRFSGKEGPLMEGGRASDRDAYSHEVMSVGFWAGDANVPAPAFYAYSYPAPEGIEKEPLLPEAANWVESNGSQMAVLMYDDMRKTANPRQALLDFMESSYQAGAKLANWDTENFTYRPA